MIIAVIAACLILWQERSPKKDCKTSDPHFYPRGFAYDYFLLWLLRPNNEAFINGLISTEKPTNWARLSVILVYPWFELISGKWNGLWFLVVAGGLLAGKKLWQGTLGVMGISLVLYLGVVMAYYGVNTFFEIGWWLADDPLAHPLCARPDDRLMDSPRLAGLKMPLNLRPFDTFDLIF